MTDYSVIIAKYFNEKDSTQMKNGLEFTEIPERHME